MLMFKIRRRLAHGTASAQRPSPSEPCRPTTSAEMGIGGDEAYAYDSVISSHTDGGAVNEPLVVDFAAMSDGYDNRVLGPPLTPPPSQKASHDQDSWFPDEERGPSTAPAPPDFTSRDIHIPSRTR
jgi:hypothetical protein